MPQASIRSLIALVFGSAVVMWLFRTMVVGNAFWAKCVSAVLVTAAACFVMYAILFLLAHLFTVVTSPIVDAIEGTSESNATTRPPEVSATIIHSPPSAESSDGSDDTTGAARP
tara:strand:+ start:101223 stop:101564 length:342 start_codon:yes stop_codon:yes gene_type:complete